MERLLTRIGDEKTRVSRQEAARLYRCSRDFRSSPFVNGYQYYVGKGMEVDARHRSRYPFLWLDLLRGLYTFTLTAQLSVLNNCVKI